MSNLVGVTDAQVWTEEWLKIIKANPDIPTDEDTMIGWFANAIMAGFDEGRRSEQRRDMTEKLREIVYQAAGAATRPLLEDPPQYIFPSDRVKEAVEEVLTQFGLSEGEINATAG